MNRRSFIAILGVIVGGIAIDKAIPFNRVWSFPKNIVISNTIAQYADYISCQDLALEVAIDPVSVDLIRRVTDQLGRMAAKTADEYYGVIYPYSAYGIEREWFN